MILYRDKATEKSRKCPIFALPRIYLVIKKISCVTLPSFYSQKMVVQLRPRAITVERGSRGFGLSLIYRGLDKYEEKDTGIFVARVVPGGQAARYGVRENDKILTINSKTPRNVDDAVGVIKQAGNQIKLVVLREEDVADNPSIIVDETAERSSLASGEMDSKWVSVSVFPTYIDA